MTENDRKNDLPIIQWYPGHMKKARELVEENLKLVDVVVELLDARIPAASSNPMLREIIGDKPRVVALNKRDLADENMTRRWLEHFRAKKIPAVALDSVSGKGMKELLTLIEREAKYRTERLVSKGVAARKARVMILGIPNVGKSSLINRLAGAAKAKTADKPGVTRAKQWIRIGADVDLLDTPGILWPKFEDPRVGLKLAFTGAVNDEIYDLESVAHLLLATLRRDHQERLQERFKFKEALPETTEGLMDAIGRKRGCLLKGGRIDFEKVQHILLAEFRMGKFGKISLDVPPTEAAEEVDDG
ncbi:ribosome biogenesis GTPase YlqF [Selenomonas sputigena]|uniref:Ribosome biogenesis GTPase A n=1 Tax=Selenomonas sputigena (strain ATCC 35185 / DSM 20758 / CCUG 44933 / VPI D19B-28) TaxID=546271 RepID=C9LW70_SELS3|nr:ribosome biogenesis GTPase YlqF [Selenomonas sputigena]AEB99852.1 ribosome biogenesis GTP-binding protein YlqF [Selenomonas sputigena ATCC 35185]EEX76873.1 ribosome biogenesis GTP-binding protein YlqF [Selenomonas sputigena ATCC 35185]